MRNNSIIIALHINQNSVATSVPGNAKSISNTEQSLPGNDRSTSNTERRSFDRCATELGDVRRCFSIVRRCFSIINQLTSHKQLSRAHSAISTFKRQQAPGLRTRSIFKRVQVRVPEIFASASSENFIFQVRVRQNDRVRSPGKHAVGTTSEK